MGYYLPTKTRKSRFVEMFGDVDLDIRGFNIVKIEDVCSDNFWIMPATPEYVEDGEVRYITSKNIKGGVLDFTDCKRISREAYGTISRKRPIQLGDFLISMIGTLGEVAVVTAVDGEFYGQNMFLLRPDVRKVDSVYLMSYLMHSTHVRRAIERSKNSSTQAYLKREHIIEMKIPLPPLALQSEFAAFVEKVDKSKFAVRKSLEELQKLYRQQLQEAFG